MIDVFDIEKAQSDFLMQNGFFVVARESAEGAQKPSCSINVFPASSERISGCMVQDVFAVELSYYPAVETQEELIKAADRLRKILLTKPLRILDREQQEERVLQCCLVEFSTEKGVLYANFEHSLHQRFPDAEEEELPFTEEDLDFEFI